MRIADIQMPLMTGDEYCGRGCLHRPRLSVISMTAFPKKRARPPARHGGGARCYLSTPYEWRRDHPLPRTGVGPSRVR